MPQVIFSEYRDANRLTKYPFADTATLTSIDGKVTLAQDVFCDASIYIPGAVAPIYIQKLNITGNRITITISDYSKQYTATGEVTPKSKSVNLLNNSEHQVGLLVATNDLTYFTSIPKGEYEFTYKATSFVPRCIVPLKDVGVTSIGVFGGKQLYGDIWLIGKDGIVIRYDEEAEVIRFDIVGDALFKREDPDFKAPAYVKTINGVPADDYGNFNIAVVNDNDILRIDNGSEGITIYAAGV